MPEPGKLYVVATPLGNLEDLSSRAARVLADVHVIAAEDTRRTGRLLAHLGIRRPLLSLHEHNEAERATAIVERLTAGQDVALVSDAGTPGISDPGHRLVRRAAEAGVPVVPVPGPSGVVAALSVAGLPCDSFFFLGFLPRPAGKARSRLREVAGMATTLVLYEAPGRTGATLRLLREVLGERRAVLARELTKLHEEILRGTLSELEGIVEGRTLKGEVTLVVEGAPRRREGLRVNEGEATAGARVGAGASAGKEADRESEAARSESVAPPAEAEGGLRVDALVAAELGRGASVRDAAAAVASRTGRPRSEVYRIALEASRKEGNGLPPGNGHTGGIAPMGGGR